MCGKKSLRLCVISRKENAKIVHIVINTSTNIVQKVTQSAQLMVFNHISIPFTSMHTKSAFTHHLAMPPAVNRSSAHAPEIAQSARRIADRQRKAAVK